MGWGVEFLGICEFSGWISCLASHCWCVRRGLTRGGGGEGSYRLMVYAEWGFDGGGGDSWLGG